MLRVKMNFIFYAFGLSAIAVFLELVQADYQQNLLEEMRNDECFLQNDVCQNGMNISDDEILALCNAKPQNTLATKCLMDCKMRQFNWINKDGFQKDEYLFYIHNSTMGTVDETYFQAAIKAADACKNVKSETGHSCETAFVIAKCLQDEGDKLHKINLGYGLFYVHPFFFDFKSTKVDSSGTFQYKK